MAFYLPLPQVCVKIEKHFIVNEVRTKSSLAKASLEVKRRYEEKIKAGSNNFSPASEKKYIVCVRMTCWPGRNGGLPDADNVAKAIIDVLFSAGDSIDIVKGMQAEGEIIDDNNEQSEIYIYSVI